MITPEKQFALDLEVFGNEVSEAIQSFYAEQTIHNTARGSTCAYRALNKHAAFWNITSRALQSNALIVLGRIFDTDRRSHGVGQLLQIAQSHPEMFSAAALEKRKRPHAGKHTEEFVSTAYIATPADFRRLRQQLDRRRRIYDTRYAALRNKAIAHKDRVDTARLFANTNIRELERLLCFLGGLHQALWDLLWNGIKPLVRPTRYSAKQILRLPDRFHHANREQERIVRETCNFLREVISESAV